MDKLLTFEQVVNNIQKYSTSNLLIGNGFSCAYDKKIFSYKFLSEIIKNDKENNVDEITKKILQLSETNNTYNLELVMRNLSFYANFTEVLLEKEEYKEDVIKSANNALHNLKLYFIDAIHKLHPENASCLPDNQAKSCFQFLNKVVIGDKGNIFSTNYDLLLYWVLMRMDKDRYNKFYDGFKYESSSDNKLTWQPEIQSQNTYYLHGSLHLFDYGHYLKKITYSEITSEGNKSKRDDKPIIEKVKSNINKDKYPLIVTSGTSNEKRQQIDHNRYLRYCYDKLKEIEDNLIVFGFSFGDNDDHITEAIALAIAKNKLHNIYIGVFSEDDIPHYNSIKNKINALVKQKAKALNYKSKLNYCIEFYNSQDVKIWDSNTEETND